MSEFGKNDLYIAPQGNNRWSGALPEPNAAGTDGPLASLARARDVVRTRKQSGRLSEPITVWLRGGRYPVRAPITFGPEDSAPVTYAAYPGETPVLDGGIAISSWTSTTINGQAAWVADLPLVDGATAEPHQLFMNGRRCPRTRLPREGFYWIADVKGEVQENDFTGVPATDSFTAAAGDIKPWQNLTDVDVVALHYWIEERLPICNFNPATNLVTSSRRSTFGLKDDWANRLARYYVENVFEALSEPGQWYADCAAGKVYYLPLADETPATSEAFIGQARQLLVIQGKPDDDRYVEFIRFEGLTFEHTEWDQPHRIVEKPGSKPVDLASASQASQNVPGVIHLEGVRYCVIEDCTIAHIGWYAIDLGDGCMGNRLVGNTITDMGAGGIKLSGSDAAGALNRRTGNNVITDNHIYDGGIVFHAAVGVLARHTYGNTISHNHIHDLFYTGISCGWVWGYADSVSCNNHIEYNHIHHLGKKLLSDMGGIYLLGSAPGTILRGNLIHDIEKWNYGGWAIYPDEGSSFVLIEKNIGYNTSSQPFHQHYGKLNIVRNNIWAFGREGVARTSKAEGHKQFIFERNILLTDGQPTIVGGYPGVLAKRDFWSELNLFWDISGQAPVCADVTTDAQAVQHNHTVFNLADWQALGFDRYSVVADPLLADPAHGDFTLAANSPALAIGFEPFDLSEVGPRPKDKR
ncbi:MAG: right-handed parallel beta-helix repeat-containing protein [Anaerolineae bacterium]